MKKYKAIALVALTLLISITVNTGSAADIAHAADTADIADNVSNITSVCDVVDTNYKWGPNEQYPVIDLFGDKEVPLFTTNGSIWDAHVNKLAKLIVDSSESHILKDGEKLDLGQGYALEAKQINIYDKKAWLEFTRDGQHIADQIVSINDDNGTWNVTLDNVQGENNVIVMRVHVDGTTSLSVDDSVNVVEYNAVDIDGIWLTDYANATTLQIGDKVGEFTLDKIVNGTNISNQGSLVFENATGSSVICNVVDTSYECDSWSNLYPLINLFGEKQVPLLASNGPAWEPHNDPIWQCHVDKLARLVLDSNDKHTLKTDENLDLGQGYSIQVRQIDIDGKKALLEFDKNGQYVDDTILSTEPDNQNWTCLRDNIQGEDNIPVLKVYVSDIYQDGNDSIVQIDGIWLIDYASSKTLKIGDKIGEFTLEKTVSGTNSSNLGSLAFKRTQTVDSSSWSLDIWKFITSKFLDEEEPNSIKASNTTV
ncbi:MAG TPA: S-layer protein domain-containing protein [Methanosarcina sp.]|nr:S-layer protein domain-containing protein [Methanosarcina sp.]